MGLITSVEEARKLLYGDRAAASGAGKSVDKSATFGQVLKEKLGGAAESLDTIFEDAASCYGLSSRLLRAVAKAESGFNTKAVSGAGAMGVMQLMPGTAKSLGVTDPFDARQNIMGGAKYLKENLDRFGDVKLALAAYNAGPNNVTKYGGVPPFKETQNYVKKIMGDLGTDLSDITNALGSTKTKTSKLLNAGLGLSSAGLDLPGTYSGLPGTGLSAFNPSLALMSSASNLSAISVISSLLEGSVQMGEDGETVTMDKESFQSLIEAMRCQMMMNASREIGVL